MRGILGVWTITPGIAYITLCIAVSMQVSMFLSIWFSIIRGDTRSLDYGSCAEVLDVVEVAEWGLVWTEYRRTLGNVGLGFPDLPNKTRNPKPQNPNP